MKALFRRTQPPPVEPVLPACVPDGMTHTEYVARRALHDFREGLAPEGRLNLAHALYVAWTKREQVPAGVAQELFSELTDGCWGEAMRRDLHG